MKKTVRWIVFALVTLVVIVSSALHVAVSRRQRTLAIRDPLTLEKLEQLADSGPSRETHTAHATDPEASELLSTLPKGLERMASPEALAEKWMAADRNEQDEAARMAGTMKVVESMLWTFGAEPTAARWACATGTTRMVVGNWDGARQYLEEVLATPPSPAVFRRACARLAWLEEDTEEAARLLELSCADDECVSDIVQGTREARGDGAGYRVDGGAVRAVRLVVGPGGRETMDNAGASALERSLTNAVELTRTTGSDALAGHYLARLRRHNPEAARRFDEESRED